MTHRQRAPHGWPVAALIIAEGFQLLSLGPWAMAMLFGLLARGVGSNPEFIAMLVAVGSYPLWLLAGGVASWVFLYRDRRVLAFVITGIATLPTLVVALLVLAGWASAYVTALTR